MSQSWTWETAFNKSPQEIPDTVNAYAEENHNLRKQLSELKSSTSSTPQAAKPEITNEQLLFALWNDARKRTHGTGGGNHPIAHNHNYLEALRRMSPSSSTERDELVEAARAYVATVEDKTAGMDACNKAFDVLRRALAARGGTPDAR
jgi:uncharacterized protein YukE